MRRCSRWGYAYCQRKIALECESRAKTGGGAVAGGTSRARLRAVRNGPGRAEPDGLGPFRQLGWPPALRLRPHVVLLADALPRVHTTAGYSSSAELHGARLSILRGCDRAGFNRSHEDRAER